MNTQRAILDSTATHHQQTASIARSKRRDRLRVLTAQAVTLLPPHGFSLRLLLVLDPAHDLAREPTLEAGEQSERKNSRRCV